MQNLNCYETNAYDFKSDFYDTKHTIQYFIENATDNIEKNYVYFQYYINNKIKDFQIDSLIKEKNKITLMERVKFANIFIDDISFNIYHERRYYFFGLFYEDIKWSDDIEKTCLRYKNKIYSSYDIMEYNINEKFNKLNNEGIELVNLIFATANSNFEELKRNIE